MPKRTRSYRSWQLEALTDPKIAADYLNAALEDSPEIFFRALGKVAQANQMSRVAKGSGLQRETLYRSLSEQGNPTYGTLRSIFGFLGLRFRVEPDEVAVGGIAVQPDKMDLEEINMPSVGVQGTSLLDALNSPQQIRSANENESNGWMNREDMAQLFGGVEVCV